MQNFLSRTLRALASSVMALLSMQPLNLGELPDELSGAAGNGWRSSDERLALLVAELGVCDMVEGAYEVLLEEFCADAVSERALRGGDTLSVLVGGVVL